MLLTDPIYYFGTFLLQKKDTNYSTFEDIKGHTVGTVTGFTLVPELKSVPGIGEVKLYDTSDGVMRDIAGRPARHGGARSGPGRNTRCSQHPEWELHQVALKPEADKYPDHVDEVLLDHGHLTRKTRSSTTRVNGEIAKAWADCENVKTMASLRPGDPDWFDAAGARTTGSASTGRRAGRRRPRRPSCFPKS